MTNLLNLTSYKSKKSYTAFFDRLTILSIIVVLPIIIAGFTNNIIISYSVAFFTFIIWLCSKYYIKARKENSPDYSSNSDIAYSQMLLRGSFAHPTRQQKRILNSDVKIVNFENSFEKNILNQLIEASKDLTLRSKIISDIDSSNSNVETLIHDISSTIQKIYLEEYIVNEEKRQLSKIQLQKLMYLIYEIEATNSHNKLVLTNTDTIKFLMESLLNQMNFFDNYTLNKK